MHLTEEQQNIYQRDGYIILRNVVRAELIDTIESRFLDLFVDLGGPRFTSSQSPELAQYLHLVVSLLYLDLDIYEPTKKALEVFLPRMPKGAIIVFDELNAKIFPGETMAVAEAIGLRNLRIERFPFDSYVSYAVLE